MQKLMMDVCLELTLSHADILVRIKEMRAAGGFLLVQRWHQKAGSGYILILMDVPQCETEMTPYEMMLSESRERMLLCVTKVRKYKLKSYLKRTD